jgi:hypothetical protein
MQPWLPACGSGNAIDWASTGTDATATGWPAATAAIGAAESGPL